MSNTVCRRCNQLLRQDELVKAEVLSRFVQLKSKLHYALEKPTECLWIEHYSCASPFGESVNDEDN